MSAATSEWPAWLRRRTAVELLGPPRMFFAWLTIALCLGAIVYVGAWNAQHYPILLGYDAQPHVDYAHVLLREHRLPTPTESGEANQPPMYYLLAGGAAILGHKLFGWEEGKPYTSLPEISYRGAQYLNVLFALLTGLSILWLARVVMPTRPWVWASSLGFFAFLPTVSKTEAMFHPENLNMLASTAALAVTTHMFVRRDFRARFALLLVISLGVGMTTRASMIFTVAALLLGLLAAVTVSDVRRRIPWGGAAALFLALVLLAVPWVVYRAVVRHQGPLNQTSRLLRAAVHPSSGTFIDRATSRDRFFVVGEPAVFQTPWRTNYKNEALPETYTDMWGDWIAAFAWSAYSGSPWGPTKQVLRDQSYIGVLPTGLAILGWLGLWWLVLRGRRELFALALMPVFGVGGYLYRSWVVLSHDGDVLKAIYALNTVGVWSLGFGLATGWIAGKSRLVRYGMVALFAIFAVLELRFMLYGIRDHAPIF